MKKGKNNEQERLKISDRERRKEAKMANREMNNLDRRASKLFH